MSISLYRLKFDGPIHFGTTGIGLEKTEELLHSDSIISALINALAVLGEADKTVEALNGPTPPFVLSSLFPFGPHKKSGVIYAVPKPLSEPPLKDRAIFRIKGKEIKRLRYIMPEDAARWLGSTTLDDAALEGLIERNSGMTKGWWVDDLRPRVALDRSSNNSSIWLCGTLRFIEGAGLYGLVSFKDDGWGKILENAFRLLGEMGVGGERTYGMGSFIFSGFEPLSKEWEPLLRGNSGRRLLLSLYYPSKSERARLGNVMEAWDVTERRGYIVSGRDTTTLKRKRLRMITEGSVFTSPVQGIVADVTPDDAALFGLNHRVFRSGLAFLLPGGAV